VKLGSPPNVKKAIIGATLLLRGDAQEFWIAPTEGGTASAEKPNRTERIQLPEASFGEAGPAVGLPMKQAASAKKDQANDPEALLLAGHRGKSEMRSEGPVMAREHDAGVRPTFSPLAPPQPLSVGTIASAIAPPPIPQAVQVEPAPVSPTLEPPPQSPQKVENPLLTNDVTALPEQTVAVTTHPASAPPAPLAIPTHTVEQAFESVATKPPVVVPDPTAPEVQLPPNPPPALVRTARRVLAREPSQPAPAPAPPFQALPAVTPAVQPLPVRTASQGPQVLPAEAPVPPASVTAAPAVAEPVSAAPLAVTPAPVAALPKPVQLAIADPVSAADPLPKPAFGGPAPGLVSKFPAAPESASNLVPPPQPKPVSISAAPKSPAAGIDRAGFASTGPRIGGDSTPILTYDDELILELQTAAGQLADTITAYGTRSGVYLPLGTITRFLDLAVSVSDEGHYASGWFLNEKQTMSINLRQGTLEVAGKELPLAKGDAAAFDGELYLLADRFADLFPLTMGVDLRAQIVTIKTKVPFPFEQRLAREQQRNALKGRGNKQETRWPRQQTPYRALAFPLADVEVSAASDSTLGSRVEGNVRLAGDLALMTARAYVSGTTLDGLTGANLQLGRRDPEAQLFGPLRATEFQIGDVSTIAMPLGLRGVSGRGAAITNSPLERVSVFDTLDLRGELPEGYEVELFRNNILIASTREQVDGEFRFLKVPVEFGLNIFRLVFFGPQGQRREEVRQYSVGDGRLSPGQFLYAFGGVQKDVNVFDIRRPDFTPPPDRGAWRSSALMQYGLSRDVTALLGGAWFQTPFGNRWQVTTGLRTGFSGTAVKLDLGYQTGANGGSGKAIELGLGGKLFGVGYTLTHAEYRGAFVDEVRSLSGEGLRRASELNINTSLKVNDGLIIPLFGQVRRYEYADGRKQMDASLQGSLPISGYMLSNSLRFDTSSNPGFATNTQLSGSFDLSRLAGSRLRLRGGVDYAILPQAKLLGAAIEADYAIDSRSSVRASVYHSLQDDRTQFGLSANRRFDRFTLSLDGSYSVPNGEYRSALRLGFSFGRNPISNSFFLAKPGVTAGGAIAARAFRDTNGNGLLDSGEELLANVDFNTASQHGTTNAKGIALLDGLGDGRRNSVVLDRATLPDLLLAPVSDGIEVISRAGRIHVADFPIQELSDVEGTVYFTNADNGLGREVSGLRLIFVDKTGKAVAKSRTDSDGSYYFEQLPPGTYSIQIDQNQAVSLKIRLVEQVSVTIGTKSDVLRQVIKIASD
jgi:hypothetical protein